jgi:hypothetical protein
VVVSFIKGPLPACRLRFDGVGGGGRRVRRT